MKNTVLNLMSAKLAFVSVLLAGLFLFAPSHVQAQTTNDLFVAPNVTYVSSQTAITKVEGQILTIKAAFETLVHGTQAYQDNEVKKGFYEAILTSLNNGKTVKASLEAGLKYFSIDASTALSKSLKSAYRQEAINLLKQ